MSLRMQLDIFDTRTDCGQNLLERSSLPLFFVELSLFRLF